MKNRRAFIVGLKSKTLNNKEKFLLKRYRPWGVILFSRNISSVNQLHSLTEEIRFIFKDKNYPILIDEEGGRVSRLNNFINTSIFSGKYFGNLYNRDYKKFNIFYKIFIKQISFLLKNTGININTVPVLDVMRKKSNKIIGNRSFGSNPKVVSKIGDFCIHEYHKNKIGTVIKHIPGHGLAKVDSHKNTPIIKENIKYLNKIDFSTFKNKKALFAMTAHIIYKDIDRYYTATHSSKVIDFIRNKIRFKNLLITDDISMKGLKYSIKDNTKMAFNAGCNLVLHCNGKYREMLVVAKNSPKVNRFIIQKTSEFYKIIS